MKGNYFLGNGRFEVRPMELPMPGPGEILVKNMACGVCGTDVHIYHGDPGSAEVTPPVVLGHEYAGIVEAVGDGEASLFQVGDHVTIDPNIYCGHCRYCRTGKKQLCEQMQAIGVTRDGGFAEFSLVPASQAFLLKKEIPFPVGAMAEPLACVLRGIDRAQIRPGDKVAVVGGGAIGLMMLQAAILSGASEVIVSEPNALRRKAALSLGAKAALDPLSGELEPFEAFADVVIECAGNNAAVEGAFSLAAKGAQIVLFSVPQVEAVYPLSLFDLYKKEWTVSGSFVNPDTHERAVRLINEGKICFEPILTHSFSLDQLEEAIHRQMSPESIKDVVEPWR